MVDRSHVYARIGLACLLLFGLAIRIPHLTDPPLEFHPTRQYRSALMARGLVVRSLKGYSAGELNAIRAAAATEAPIEPPVFEHAAALAYRIMGREALWIPRLMGVTVWVLGALAIWWLVVRGNRPTTDTPADDDARAPSSGMGSTRGIPFQQDLRPLAGLVAVAVYLFLPYGRPASQAFQPDALMTALTTGALAALAWRHRAPSIGSGFVALLLAAAAVFIKPMAVFFILPVALVLSVSRYGFFRGASRFTAWTAAVVAPATAWYIYVALSFPSTFEDRFFPQLLTRAVFWTGWLTMIDRVVTWPMCALALAGIAFAERHTRRVLVAAWMGYVAFGLLFTHHIQTHDYYSLPLITLVAWSIGALVNGVWPSGRRDSEAHATLQVQGAMLRSVALVLVPVAAAMAWAWRTPPYEADPGSIVEAARYERIGRLVNHSTRVVSLDGNYAVPLNYHGLLVASNLPLSFDRAISTLAGRSVTAEAEAELAGRDADFFVATHQPEFDARPDLRALLDTRYPLIERDGTARSWHYLVYDLRRSRIVFTPERMSAFARLPPLDRARGNAGPGPTAPAAGPVNTVKLWTAAGSGWRLVVSRPDLVDVSPLEGTGPAVVSVAARASAAEAETSVEILAYGEGDTEPSGSLKLRVRAFRASKPVAPFGFVDAPGDPVILRNSPVVFMGWAVDDLGLRRIWVEYQNRAGAIVSLGEAVRSGSRPDIASAYPAAFDVYNCAWTFTLHPGMLRNESLPLVLRFYVEDTDGLRKEIGTRTVRR